MMNGKAGLRDGKSGSVDEQIGHQVKKGPQQYSEH
jgi:hypothetical protein